MELSQLETFYIPLNCQPSQQLTFNPPKLRDEIVKFLGDPHLRVCLLLGDAGSGKTIFTYLFQQHLWRDYQIYTRVPIRIEMKQFSKETSEIAVYKVVESVFETTKQIEQLRKDKTLKFLFIFDGLDELSGGGIPNLWESNKLYEWGEPGTAKAIITCRPEYLLGIKTYKAILGPSNAEGVSQLSERYLSSLDRSQIEDYLRNPKARESLSAFTESEVQEYEKSLLETPDIFNILNTPFMLKVAVSALPALKESGNLSKAPRRQLMRVDLYDGFMKTWFEREQTRLAQIVKDIGDVASLFKGFSQQLAFAMFGSETYLIERKEQLPLSKYAPKQKMLHPQSDKLLEIWTNFFSDTNEESKIARRGCPLRCVEGKGYSFVHRSFLEYFVADYLWSSLMNDDEYTAVDWGTRFLAEPKPQRMSVIVDFLAERLLSKESSPERNNWIERLFHLVRASKGEISPSENVLRAASNAITVLARTGVSFTLKQQANPGFFKGIKIPFADLSMAQLCGVDLAESALRDVRLVGAKLQAANLSRCIFSGVDFQQIAPLRGHKGTVTCVAISANGLRIVSGSGDKTARMWKADGTPGPVLRIEKMVCSVAISTDGLQVVSGLDDNTVQVWGTDGKPGSTFKPGSILRGHEDIVTSVAMSADGLSIVSGSRDKTLRIWLSAWDSTAIVCNHPDVVSSVAISADGLCIVSGSLDKMVRVWEASGKPGPVLCGHEIDVSSVAVSANKMHIVSGSSDMTVRVWRADDKLNFISGPILRGHDSYISGVAISANGLHIVSGSDDKTVRVWAADGTPGPILRGHESKIRSVALSTDGLRIVSGSSDKTLRVWGVDSPLGPLLHCHDGWVSSVAISANGLRLVSGSYDKTVRVWEADGTPGPILRGHEYRVNSVAISADGKLIVSGSDDKTVRMWSADGTPGTILQGHEIDVSCVAMSADGKRIVSGSTDKSVRVWFAHGTVGTPGPILCGHEHKVSSVAMSADGLRIVSGSSDMTVRVWEVDATQGHILQVLLGHETDISSVAISANGLCIVSGSNDGTLRVWGADDTPGPVLRGHEGMVSSVAISADGLCIVSGSRDNTVRMWGADGTVGSILRGHEDTVSSVAMSQDLHIVSGSSDKTVRVWGAVPQSSGESYASNPILCSRVFDVHNMSISMSADGLRVLSGSSGKVVRVWRADGTAGPILCGHEGRVSSIGMSANGLHIVSGSWDMTVRVWGADGTAGRILSGHQDRISSVAISADGLYVAAGSDDGTLQVWGADGQQLFNSRGHEDRISSVALALSAGKLTIVSGSWDEAVRVWQADETGRVWQADSTPSPPLLCHDDRVSCVEISADGKYIVSGSDDETVRVWEVNGKTRTLRGHEGIVNCVTISPDGLYIVSGSDDRTVRVWGIDGKPVSVFRGHEDKVIAVIFAFAGNGDSTVISGSIDQTIRTWSNGMTPLSSTIRLHERGLRCGALFQDGHKIFPSPDGITIQVIKEGNVDGLLLCGHDDTISCLSFSAVSKRIVSGSFDKTVRVWRIDESSCVVCNGHQDAVITVAFSADGQHVASGSYDRTVQVWRIDGTVVTVFRDHKGPVRCIAFAGDGRRIVSSSDDNTMQVWTLDRLTGPVVCVHEYQLTSVAISENGQNITSASVDNTVRLWGLDGIVKKEFKWGGATIAKVAFTSGDMRIFCTDRNVTCEWSIESSNLISSSAHWIQTMCIPSTSKLDSFPCAFDSAENLTEQTKKLLLENQC